MRWSMLVLMAVGAVAMAACSSPSNTAPPVTQLTSAPQAFDVLKVAGQACAKDIKLVNGVAVCGPVGETGLTVSVAFYSSAQQAKQQFEQHCSGDTWNLYRDGQNWRGALSVSNGTISPAGARSIADALSTDAIHGCGGSTG